MRSIRFIASCLLVFAAVPALADDHLVTALTSPNRFEPAALTIDVGDTVTFVNGGGFHNVVSDKGSVTVFRCANGCDGDGGSGEPAGVGWSATVTFPTAGSAPYHCEVHGGNMSGTITIVGGTPAASIVVEPTSLTGAANEGTATSIVFSIANAGDAALTWNVDTASTACATPDVVPWLSLAPLSGSVPVGPDSTNVDVTLDATSLVGGVYQANICVHSNDAANDPVTLPVTFTVSEPDTIFIDGFEF